MAKLVFIGEKFGGRVYEVLAPRSTVGRGSANTLSIPDSSVSEQHCEIYDNGADLIIRDLGSRNGTVVNGKLLRNAQAPLAPGEIVKFGAVAARLEIPERSSASDTVTDVTAIHFHAHVVTHPTPTPPVAPALPLAEAASAPGEQTLLLPRLEAKARPADLSAPLPAPTVPAGRNLKLIALGLGLVVGLLLWVILWR
jgi:predicted component of type VI protein secretion system